MEIEEVILQLRELHKEFGDLIDKLEEIDTGENIEYYSDILRDYHWDNVMLNNRLSKIKLDLGVYE